MSIYPSNSPTERRSTTSWDNTEMAQKSNIQKAESLIEKFHSTTSGTKFSSLSSLRDLMDKLLNSLKKLDKPKGGGTNYTSTEELRDAIRENMVELADKTNNGIANFNHEELASSNVYNKYWRNSGYKIELKDNVKASDAVEYFFENHDDFSIDCSTSVVALSLKAQLDALGSESFNEYYKEGIELGGFKGSVLQGADVFRLLKRNEKITVNGIDTKYGDLDNFDKELGDKLVKGDIYYFDKPGDTTSSFQGWNVVYLGKKGSKHQFWTQMGIETVELENKSGVLIAKGGTGLLKNHYLGASISDPNAEKFKNYV